LNPTLTVVEVEYVLEHPAIQGARDQLPCWEDDLHHMREASEVLVLEKRDRRIRPGHVCTKRLDPLRHMLACHGQRCLDVVMRVDQGICPGRNGAQDDLVDFFCWKDADV
jgi:hypothetical protein